MKLSAKLRESSSHIWDSILRHPFVVELYSGRLPLEKFKYYVIQDYNFLVGMTKAFSIIAAKTREYDLLKTALELAYGDVTIEMDNYIKLLNKLGLSLEEVIRTEPAPTNYAYVNHILVTCTLYSPLECMVSMLPCFWSYMVIAETHKNLLENNPVEVYKDWALVYLSKEYRDLTTRLINIVDDLWNRYGSDYEFLDWIFKTSSRYEYLFWDMAYNIERWKPE
ncbi:MAG: thiaminase II [Thermoprotei archaeon]